MKQVFLRSGVISVVEVPPPAYSDNEVLVANAYSVISVGTELSMVRGSKGSSPLGVLKNPDLMKKALNYVKKNGLKKALNTAREFQESSMVPLGYSSAGIVIVKGKNIADVCVGDKVACAGAGKASHAEIVSVPRNLVAKIPENISFKEAAFATLGAIAMHGIRRAEGQFGETIVVLGAGLIGQLVVQIAKAAGYRVVAVDKNPDRVDLAIKMGADLGLIVEKHEVEKEVLCYTGGLGADSVVICAATPSDEPVNQAMRMIRKRGRVVVVGSVGMNLERQQFYEKEADFLISRSYGPGRYDPLYEEKGLDYPIEYVRWTENRNMQAFLNLLKDEKVDVKPLISTVFPIDEAEKAYGLLTTLDEKGHLAILFKYDPSKYISATEKITLPKKAIEISPRTVKGKINVAVVGAGSFAKGTLLPLISKISDYNLKAIVTSTGINAKQTALKYKAEYCTTDYKEVLGDDNVDLVIISTRHNLHYPMIIDAAKAGKAIYVEKPMCLNEDELEKIVEVVSESKVPLIVGFNRRYSPLSAKAKELLKQKHGPYMINYRVNAGFIPKTYWVQDPEVGGGRIIGECCHFFDLFNYLIGSDLEDIKIEVVPVNNTTVVANDNVVVTMRWKDGSLTMLTYTSLGHMDLSKERIEIFADKSSIIIDDFKEMKLYGFQERSIKLKKQDKGHYGELTELAKFLKGEKSSIISFYDCVKAMNITFSVERLLEGRRLLQDS
jgi:predicted dehydrogenase/threonine dehydrogenase-like Zn-dependent dehydrogenase